MKKNFIIIIAIFLGIIVISCGRKKENTNKTSKLTVFLSDGFDDKYEVGYIGEISDGTFCLEFSNDENEYTKTSVYYDPQVKKGKSYKFFSDKIDNTDAYYSEEEIRAMLYQIGILKEKWWFISTLGIHK